MTPEERAALRAIPPTQMIRSLEESGKALVAENERLRSALDAKDARIAELEAREMVLRERLDRARREIERSKP